MQELGNGNFPLVSYKPRDHVDLSAFGKPSDATVVDAEIQELTPAGSLVWSWNSKEHIDLAETDRWWSTPPTRLPDGRDAYDYAHINAVEPDGSGLVVSLRHTDAIYRISRSYGQIEWKLGGTTTGESLIVSGDPLSHTLGGQHDVRRLADGTVSVFDNGSQLSRPPRVARFRIDAAARTAVLVESLSDSEIPTSVCCGGARKLSSNGWLVAWGGNPVIAEYAADKSRIFKLHFTDTGAVLYRAFPVPGGRISAAQGMDSMFPR